MADHPVTSNEADPSVSAAIPGDAIRTAARLELLAHQRRQRAFPKVEIKDFPWQALLYLTSNSDCHGWVSEQQLLDNLAGGETARRWLGILVAEGMVLRSGLAVRSLGLTREALEGFEAYCRTPVSSVG
jgi:hypothetical protein